MSRPGTHFRPVLPAAIAGTAALLMLGCATMGGDYTEVYGDYGYTGAWGYGPFVPDGYAVGRPPYERQERPGGRAPEHPPGNVPPTVHNAPRQPPSIPNNPRSGGGGGGGGGGSRGGGGGGGGHSSGGGGGGHASSGGNGNHK